MKNAALEVSKSEHLLATVRTRRWPDFEVIVGENWLLTPQPNFNALGSYPGVLPIPIPITSATNLVSNRQPTALMTGLMAQPLSQQYRIGLNISMHGVMRDISREQLRAKRQTVVDDVKRTYFNILQTQSSLESTEEDIKFLRELNRLASRYLKEKTVLKSELLEAQARLAQEEQNQIVLRNQLATQKEQLNDLMGRNILTEFRVNPVPEATALENDLGGARTGPCSSGRRFGKQSSESVRPNMTAGLSSRNIFPISASSLLMPGPSICRRSRRTSALPAF